MLEASSAHYETVKKSHRQGLYAYARRGLGDAEGPLPSIPHLAAALRRVLEDHVLVGARQQRVQRVHAEARRGQRGRARIALRPEVYRP